MDIVTFPKFSDLFPDEDLPKIEDELREVPSSIVINIASYWMAHFLQNAFEVASHINLIERFLETFDEEIRKILSTRLDKFYNNRETTGMGLFSPYILLTVIQDEINNLRPGKFADHKPEMDYKIFRSFLIYNEIYDSQHTNTIVRAKEIESERSGMLLNAMMWPILAPSMEFYSSSKFYFNQAYLGLQFFKFLEYAEKFNPFLEEFLKKNNVKSYKDYLKHLLLFIINGYRKDLARFAYKYEDNLVEVNPVVKQFVLDLNQVNPGEYNQNNLNIDFKGLRVKPILKDTDNKFLVSNWNLFIDKFHRGLIIDFFNNSNVKSLYKNSSFNDYQNDIGLDYAEKNLFVKYMNIAFKKDCICYSDDLETLNVDFYLRYKNQVALFEFKNNLIKKEDDYDSIKNNLDRVFYRDKKDKAILQIKKQILQLCDDYISVEDLNAIDLNTNNLIIYPVVVYTDPLGGMPGVNKYYNSLFKDEMKDVKHPFFMLRQLVMINFDSIITLMESFKRDNSIIFNLFHNYLGYLDIYNGWKDIKGYQLSHIPIEKQMSSFIREKKMDFKNSFIYKELVEELEIPK